MFSIHKKYEPKKFAQTWMQVKYVKRMTTEHRLTVSKDTIRDRLDAAGLCSHSKSKCVNLHVKINHSKCALFVQFDDNNKFEKVTWSLFNYTL